MEGRGAVDDLHLVQEQVFFGMEGTKYISVTIPIYIPPQHRFGPRHSINFK